MIILWIFGFLHISSLGFTATFTDIGDFSAFDNKPVVALWRGVHFAPSHFINEQARHQYMEAHSVLMPIYCAAAHRWPFQGNPISPLHIPTSQEILHLDSVVTRIQLVVKKLEAKGSITLNRQLFHNYRDAFHQYYSNSTKFIASIGAIPQRKFEPLISEFPTGNPLLSFSTEVKHAAAYGYGLKDYGPGNAILEPEYDLTGKPQHSVLGYLEGVLLTDEAAISTLPYNVVLHHLNKDINIKRHFSNDILSEKEVSLTGYVPGKYVVFTSPLEVPSFVEQYNVNMKERFGLGKIKYNNIRNILTDKQTPKDQKKRRVTRMMNEIIEIPAEENSIVSKAKTTLEEAFGGESRGDTLEYVKGIVDLNGRVRKKSLSEGR